jgi:hypothetical protein
VLVSDNHARLRCARTVALAAVFACFLVIAPVAGAATRTVAAAGADAGNCVSVPCASMGYAYGQSSSGDVVNVAPGLYGEQNIPGGSKSVVFRARTPVKLRALYNDASNVTFDGFDIDAGFAKSLGFHNSDGSNVTFKNGRIGRITDEKGALLTGRRFTFDNVVFHDVLVTDEAVHNECIYALDVTGLTIRNSHFYNCATMDVFFTYGTWWTPKPPSYGNITLENNVFEHSTKAPNPNDWHYYSVYIGWTGDGGGPISNWVVRNNTFEIAATFDDAHRNATGSRWVNNLGSWDCLSGMTYRGNVGRKCSAADKSVNPASSTQNSIAPLGWIDPLSHDFRLKPGSPAINAGVADAPATDRRGVRRDAHPDAGAFEFGNGAGTGVPSGSGLALRYAKLTRRVICRNPRRGCPGKTRVRVGLSTGARVAVRVKRVRKGHRPKKVRSFGFNVAGRGAAKIKAKRYRKGRYIVVVRAKQGGSVTRARALKLRVR